MNKLSSTMTCTQLTPRLRPVICLILSLARFTLLGEIPSFPFNSSRWPRNLRSPTGATALFFAVDPEVEFLFQKPSHRKW
jgi:hypothetical protein